MVDNTIFTSRVMSGYHNVTTGYTYPSAWPLTNDLLSFYTTGTDVRPHLQLFNPYGKPLRASGVGGYDTIGCKTSGGYVNAIRGILLRSVGPTTPTSGVYYGVDVVSDGTPPDSATAAPGQFNLFDYLNNGIQTVNSNLTVKGAWFSLMHPQLPTNPGGAGVYATNVTTSSADIRLQVNPSTTGSPASDKCYFYNCRKGVWSTGVNRVNCSYNNLYSDHIATAPNGLIGDYGYDITTTPVTSIGLSVQCKGNYMVNIDNGIAYNTDNETYVGNVNLNYNQIVGWVPSWPWGYTTRAIYAQDGGTPTGLPIGGTVAIRNNIIYRVYNGIKLMNFKRWSAKTDTNTIGLTLNSGVLQYGIKHEACVSSNAVVNYVVGDDMTGSTTSGQSGIVGYANSTTNMRCNTVDSTYKGFEFIGASNITTWRNNNMNNHTFSLHLSGIFGVQGTSSSPSDNAWFPSCSALGGGVFHTYLASGSGLSSSALFVRDNIAGTPPIILDPWANAGIGTAYYAGLYNLPCSLTYDATTLIQVLLPPLPYNRCSPNYSYFPTGSLFMPMVGGGDSVTTGDGSDSLEERSTEGSANIKAGRRWMNQMAVWEALQNDTAMADSFPVLQSFKVLAANSRYKWLTDIGASISEGNYSTANSLLAYDIDSLSSTNADETTGVMLLDGTGANYLVQNYIDVYRLSLKYATDTLSSDDSAEVLTLASLCPGNEGKIVFAARALYYNLTGNVLEPLDNCLDSDTTHSRAVRTNQPAIKRINDLPDAGQSYTLQPNPNNGNLTLQQKINDTNPVKVQVWNAVGKVVYNCNAVFVSGKLNIQLQNCASGLYLLQLSDTAGSSFTRKFVIE